MSSNKITWKLKLTEDIYTQIQLVARYAKVDPHKLANRVFEDFLVRNRPLILSKSPDTLKKFILSGKIEAGELKQGET